MDLAKFMRLLFLCSSLEPGRDGVGDHTRLLAEACTRRGHVCALLALNDPFATASFASAAETKSGPIAAAHLPAALSWKERVAQAVAFRERFHPDWVSFQLVPYAYHPRGLLGRLAGKLRDIAGDGPLHIMFHELWLGGGEPTPWRHRLTGFFQRRGIGRLLRKLRPRLVTTSNAVYAAMLRELGAETMLLPLFGNVPIAEEGGAAAKPVSAALAGAGITRENRAGWWLGLFFGALHAEWEPEPFLPLLLKAAAEANRRIVLARVGRIGDAGEKTWRKMEAAYGPQVMFLNAGELPPPTISAWLRAADFGVAASPWQLIGKSGSAAAMLDQGLPVIVTRDDFRPNLPGDEAPSLDPLVHRFDETLREKLVAGLPKRPARHRADEIAALLCAALEAASIPAAS